MKHFKIFILEMKALKNMKRLNNLVDFLPRCFIVQAQTANIELKFLSDQTAMQESIEQYMQTVGQQARQASRVFTSASTPI